MTVGITMISTSQQYSFPLVGESPQSKKEQLLINGQAGGAPNSTSNRSRTPSLTLNGAHDVPPILPVPSPNTAQKSSHSRKHRKQRGLSISSGVSYTNFYNKVQPNTHFDLPRLDEYNYSYSSSSLHPISSKHAAISAWLAKFDLKIISLCALWYISSIISSNLSKAILRNFRYPVTLTEIQFFVASFLCLLTFNIVHRNKSFAQLFPLGTFPAQINTNVSLYDTIKPTRLILVQTIPMGMFQFVGHITSHNATSLISVAMVHTVKALSPIVTVLSYRFFYHVHYPLVTYITLAPLIVGIMLTCLFKSNSKNSSSLSTTSSDHFKGLVFAFISMIIFVSQNIFAKKILTYKTNLLKQDDENAIENLLPIDRDEERTMRKISEKKKIDKLTILFYCSIVGFIFTLPIYISSEFFSNKSFSLFDLNSYIMFLMLSHGIIHFFQALLAFHILGLVTPVSYSIANIFKRIVVILAALVWEAQPVNSIQGLGLVLTMFGLYAYDTWGNNKHKL